MSESLYETIRAYLLKAGWREREDGLLVEPGEWRRRRKAPGYGFHAALRRQLEVEYYERRRSDPEYLAAAGGEGA